MTPEQLGTIVLTTVLSLVASLLTAYLTSKVSRENEMRKRIHEKRLELYLEFHDVLEKMLVNRKIVFEHKYYDEVASFKPRIKLLASENTVEQYRILFEYVKTAVNNYEKYEREHDPDRDPNRIYYDEDGIETGYDEPTKEDYEEFARQTKNYKSEKRPSNEITQKMIDNIYTSLRKDLGSNLK